MPPPGSAARYLWGQSFQTDSMQLPHPSGSAVGSCLRGFKEQQEKSIFLEAPLAGDAPTRLTFNLENRTVVLKGIWGPVCPVTAHLIDRFILAATTFT